MIRTLLLRDKVILDKPRYIGMAFLDISKIIMYNCHYDFIMKQYTEAKLFFTDTDGFCYIIPNNNMYVDIKERLEWFEFSNYDVNHKNWDNSHILIPEYF